MSCDLLQPPNPPAKQPPSQPKKEKKKNIAPFVPLFNVDRASVITFIHLEKKAKKRKK